MVFGNFLQSDRVKLFSQIYRGQYLKSNIRLGKRVTPKRDKKGKSRENLKKEK